MRRGVSPRKGARRNTSRIVRVGRYLRGIWHFLLLGIELAQLTVLHRAIVMPLHPAPAKSRLRDLQSCEVTSWYGMRLAQRLCLGLPINII